jgi:hypothetical protein
MPAGWAAAAAGAGSALGGLFSAGGAEAGAEQQAQAEEQALAQQKSMFNTTLANESPFLQGGISAENNLNYLLGEGTPGQYGAGSATPVSNANGGFGSLNTPFNLDTFKSLTPQYNFNLQQGAQGTLNSAASGQGALSGAALKDLVGYNQNYANNSYNTAFQNYTTQQNNIFSRLSGLASLGQGAASNQATGASQFGQSIGNTQAGIGAALGAGSVAAGNDLGSAASNLGGILGGSNYNPNVLGNGSYIPSSVVSYAPGATGGDVPGTPGSSTG